MFEDTYNEIKSPSSGIYKEKGSRFISYIYPVQSLEDVKVKLEEVKKIEHSASHRCYAFVLNPDKSAQKANDDGEPSSTAGKPILGQILSNDLTNTLIIVVRYFGGIKLGASGLIRSYKTAAAAAINNSEKIIKIIKEYYEISFKYSQMNDIMRIVKEYNLEIINTDFQLECKLIIAVQRSNADAVKSAFNKYHEIIIIYLKTT
tara:strand:+ start:1333 stop:1944 length:612 start_codon:yes stop_codon:yes gene_type:complete